MHIFDRVHELQTLSKSRLRGVHPVLIAWSLKLIEIWAYEDLFFGAFQGRRTHKHQRALYLQGRASLEAVNTARRDAGLGPISDEENKKIVTKADAGQGWHEYGAAVDFVEDGDPTKAGIQWSWSNNLNYAKLGRVVSRIEGLEWGGFWKSFKDYPHIQMTGGLSLIAAKAFHIVNNSVENDRARVWLEIDKRLPASLLRLKEAA